MTAGLGEVWGESPLWFSREGTGQLGSAGLGLARLNNSRDLRNGGYPGGLGPGPGVIRVGASGPECHNLRRDVAVVDGLRNGLFADAEHITQWLASSGRGSPSSRSARSPDPKYQNVGGGRPRLIHD